MHADAEQALRITRQILDDKRVDGQLVLRLHEKLAVAVQADSTRLILPACQDDCPQEQLEAISVLHLAADLWVGWKMA